MKYGLEYSKSGQTVFVFSSVAEMKYFEVNFSERIEMCSTSFTKKRYLMYMFQRKRT